MKKKFDFRILIIIILVIVLAGMVYFVVNSSNSNIQISSNKGISQTTKSNENNTTTSTTKATGTSEITSGLEENLALHATYYYSEIYVEENQAVAKGENILKYTNGEYLVAPYDCVVTAISVPEVSGQCTNKHYITVVSTSTLQAKIKVSEEKISNISIGDEAQVTVEAVQKDYSAVVTNISSTASNGYFTVTVEFENDGDVKIGMTGNIKI